MSESVTCLPPRVSLCTHGRRAGREQVGGGWRGPVPPSQTPLPPQPLPSCIYSSIWLIYSMAVCVLKTVLSYKNIKTRAGLGVKTNSKGHPCERIPLPQGMNSLPTSQSRWRGGAASLQLRPRLRGGAPGVRGPWAKGTWGGM